MKQRTYAYSIKTLLMNTLISDRVNSLPCSMCRSSIKANPHFVHYVPRGHIETDPTTSGYFVTLSLEYPKAPFLIWILGHW